jgi:bifunctional UDP-N-acetylglucosamine pyrophosphorylase / glucosamine-1-phosphate N-acetyltransferase
MAASETHVVILAAGQGTRMKSSLPKVLHAVAGRPMIERVLETANSLSPNSITLIVGYKAETVRARLGKTHNVVFAVPS